MFNEENYIIENETTNIAKKQEYWDTGIGLNKVDNLEPSKYLLDLSQKNINGELKYNEVENLLKEYYKTQNSTDINIQQEKECDLVSLRIASLLDDKTFGFSPISLKNIHKYLFKDIYDFAGSYRTYNITKKENILNGDTVKYVNYQDIESYFDYDFKEEKHFDYSKDCLAHEQIQFPFTSKNQAHDYNIKWGYDDTTETDLSEEESSFLDEICGDYLIEHVGYRYIFHIAPDCVTVEEPSGNIDEYSSVYVSQDGENDYCLVAKGDRGNYIFTQGVYGDVYCSSAGETATKDFEDENSRLTHLPDDYQEPVEPYVGMTAEQVEDSTWGKPNDINKTTTQYGVNEQWVYSNDKYIYLEDGVVTAIQE